MTTTSIVKLQVPMEKTIRDALEKRATSLGFDSAQAYIRFWAKAEADGRQVDLDVDEWGPLSPKAAARLDRLTDEAVRDYQAGTARGFTDPVEVRDHLHNL